MSGSLIAHLVGGPQHGGIVELSAGQPELRIAVMSDIRADFYAQSAETAAKPLPIRQGRYVRSAALRLIGPDHYVYEWAGVDR